MLELIRDRGSVEERIKETTRDLSWALLANDQETADREKRALDGYRRLSRWLERSPLLPAEVLRITAARHRVSVSQILSSDRSRQTCRARKEVARILSVDNRMSSPEIGAVMNRRHAAILRYLKEAP